MKLLRPMPLVMLALLLLASSGGVLAQDAGPIAPASPQAANGPGFSYDGRLFSGGAGVSGACDFEFSLWNAASSGAQVGGLHTVSGVIVTAGLFSATVNSGAQFGPTAYNGDARWLAIAVRCPTNTGSFIPLTPRQELSPTPYAHYALAAGSATTALTALSASSVPWSGITGIPAGFADDTDNVGGGGGGDAWQLTGNTAAATDFLGTTNNVSLTLRVSNTVALRLAPSAGTPNVLGGNLGNLAYSGVEGAAIGGGGSIIFGGNTVTASFAVIGGGAGNVAAYFATVGGGLDNGALDTYATIGGGTQNTAALLGTVSGGSGNDVTASAGTIGGGQDNLVAGEYATVGGGYLNQAGGYSATVSGGQNNMANHTLSTVAGGNSNSAAGYASAVGGGTDNVASGLYAIVAGGQENTASNGAAAIGGGYSNLANDPYATISGGYDNSATDPYVFIGGGSSNSADADYVVVVGGYSNAASEMYATIGGGFDNTITAQFGAIGGGEAHYVSAHHATVAGGEGNFATQVYATIGGGFDNLASGIYSTVTGGESNVANDDYATTSGGRNNSAQGEFSAVGGGYSNIASGDYSTVPGGIDNRAIGDGSVAVGSHAHAVFPGSFVFADVSIATPISSTANNQFQVRAVGGVNFYSNTGLTTGCFLASGGVAWSCVSDRNQKENFAPVDGIAVLNTLMGLPIESWNAKTQDAAIRHMGPMAQDWYAAFGLGEGDKTITGVDADGVALAAIQGLYTVVQEKEDRISALEATVAALQAGSGEAPAPAAAGGYGQVLLGLVLGAGIAAGAFLVGRAAPRRS